MIFITLKVSSEKRMFDLQVNTDQKIKSTLRILQEAGLISEDEFVKMKYVYSERQKRKINIGVTYEQAQIYQGDIISCGEGILPIVNKAGIVNG